MDKSNAVENKLEFSAGAARQQPPSHWGKQKDQASYHRDQSRKSLIEMFDED